MEERTGLLAAVNTIDAHNAGMLVVTKRDRLARQVPAAALVDRLCEREGARIQTADGAATIRVP